MEEEEEAGGEKEVCVCHALSTVDVTPVLDTGVSHCLKNRGATLMLSN